MSSLICPNCGYQTENSEPFCYKCGTKMAHAEEKVSCPFCGVKVKQDSAFCSHCGRNLNVQSGEFPVVDDKHEIEPNTDAQDCMHRETKKLAAKTIVSDPVIEKLKSEAEQGNAEAQEKLGQFYYLDGEDGEQDKIEALYWFRKAAEQGNAEAQLRLGSFYSLGFEDDVQNQTKADEWYKKAADQGNAEAQIQLGERSTGNLKVAIKWFAKAAEQGNVYAQRRLGDCFKLMSWARISRPSDSQKYEEEAIMWWRKAAEQGSNEAQFALADYYHFGGFRFRYRSVADDLGDLDKQDLSEAEKWCRMAVEQYTSNPIWIYPENYPDAPFKAQEMRDKLSAYIRKSITRKDVLKIAIIQKYLIVSNLTCVLLYLADMMALSLLQRFISNQHKYYDLLMFVGGSSCFLFGYFCVSVLASYVYVRKITKKKIGVIPLLSSCGCVWFIISTFFMPDWPVFCAGASTVFGCLGVLGFSGTLILLHFVFDDISSVLQIAFPFPRRGKYGLRWKTIKKLLNEQKIEKQL